MSLEPEEFSLAVPQLEVIDAQWQHSSMSERLDLTQLSTRLGALDVCPVSVVEVSAVSVDGPISSGKCSSEPVWVRGVCLHPNQVDNLYPNPDGIWFPYPSGPVNRDRVDNRGGWLGLIPG